MKNKKDRDFQVLKWRGR